MRANAMLLAHAPRLFRARDRIVGRSAADHGENPRRGPRILEAGQEPGRELSPNLRTLGVALFLLGLCAAPAQAADPAALRGVASACQTDAVRFCAVPGDVPVGARSEPEQQIDGRDAYICLRPYRTSVSLACRRAITAGH